MNTKPVGGRGKRAPYQTAIVRVPTPLVGTVERLATSYREAVLNHKADDVSVAEFSLLSSKEAVEQARKILNRKKSAKASLEYLLQVLFPEQEIKLDK
jgi:hypothetical protein